MLERSNHEALVAPTSGVVVSTRLCQSVSCSITERVILYSRVVEVSCTASYIAGTDECCGFCYSDLLLGV